jgi:CAAX protease family protein
MSTVEYLSNLRSPAPKYVASRAHTFVLVVIFLAFTLGGAFFQRAQSGQPAAAPNSHSLSLYLSVIAMEWGLVFYLWKGGLRRTGTSMRELIGGSWPNASAFVRDVLLAAGLWCIWTVFGRLWTHWVPASGSASIQSLLPRQPLEILLWVLVSVSAGFCEEVVFRGYFQRQFQALTRSAGLAVILQAGLFGVAHGYQGIQACIRIAILGLLYGVVSQWRKSLRPGMLAHAGFDILSGIFRI